MANTYANVCNVSSTREEMTLLFGTNQTWHTGQSEVTVQLTNRIIVNPYAAKRLSMLLGNVVIYVPGLLWLTKFVGADQVLAAGLTPFLIGDGLKLLLAVAALPLAWMLVRRIRP